MRGVGFATHTSATIIDRHDFGGDILELIEEAEKHILTNICIGMRLEGLRRVHVLEISRDALREAIINTLCHRDRHDPDYVQIAVFRDRVEIRSAGGLYGDLTIDDLRRGNVSRRRNPFVAEMLRRIHLVEAWGRGMPLILEHAPDVAFTEVAGLFIARFSRPMVEDATPGHPATAHETPNDTKDHQRTPRRFCSSSCGSILNPASGRWRRHWP